MTNVYDFCVIGGGITGLTTAVLLLEKGHKVCVFEKNTLSQNSSSNNAGQLVPGYKIDNIKIAKVIGSANIKKYIDPTYDSITLIKMITSKYNLDCDLTKNPYLIVNSYNNLDVSNKSTFLEGTYCFNVQKYLIGLKKIIATLGGEFYENTEILSCESNGSIHSNNEVYWGTCGIILASNGTDNLNIFPQKKISLLKTYLLKSKPLEKEELDWPQNFAVSSPTSVLHYCRLLPDRSLFLGVNPKLGYGESELFKTLREEIKKIFPKKDVLEFSSLISGQISITKNGMPLVGLLNDKIFYSGGCYGRGLVIGTMVAQAISDKISKSSSLFDCLSKIQHEDIILPNTFETFLSESLLNLKKVELQS